MYKDMYNTYDNEHIPYNYPHSFQEDKKFDYLNGIEPTYTLDYGDTITLPFKVCDMYRDYTFDIIIYNFRYEPIKTITTYMDDCGVVYLPINVELSEDVLKKGIYFIQIQAYYCIPGGEPCVKTVLPLPECSLRVR